jgi:hypothetical protein
MFKDIQSGISKFFDKRGVPILVIILFSAVLMYYSSSKSTILDKMSDGSADKSVHSGPTPSVTSYSEPTTAPAVKPTTAPTSVPTTAPGAVGGYQLQPVANPSDLLPQDANSQWAELNPIGNGSVAMPDLLRAGHHIGLDTIGQTLKNANLQLRSDPIIEKKDIGPWNQSTYEADYGRVPLEVGYGSR